MGTLLRVQKEPIHHRNINCRYFGQWIKEKRMEMGLTQIQLAKFSGIPQTTLSGWETGKITNFRVDERLKKLANALSVRICEIPLDSLYENDLNRSDH